MKTKIKQWSFDKKLNMVCAGIALTCMVGVYAIEFLK